MILRRFKKDPALLFVILLPAIIITAAVLIGVKTSPNYFLPKEITGRFADFDKDLLYSVKNDIELIKNGFEGMPRGRMITEILIYHADPFFLLGMILPSSVLGLYFRAVYVLRFSLAALSIYCLIKYRIRIRSSLALILSLEWALCAPLLITGQISAVMNMAIILPWGIFFADRFMKEKAVRDLAGLICTAAALFISGVPGSLLGVPSLIMMILLLSISNNKKASKTIKYFLGLSGTVILGAVPAAFALLPRFYALEADIDLGTLFDDAQMNFTMYDLFQKLIPAIGSGTETNAVPAFSFGIFALFLVFLFFFNGAIPVRLKASVLTLFSVVFVFASFGPFNKLTSVYGISGAFNAARMICLVFMFMFVASVSAANMKAAGPVSTYMAALCVILIPLLGNISANESSMRFYPMYMTAACAAACAIFVNSLNKEDLLIKRIVFMLCALFVLSFNSCLTLLLSSANAGDLKIAELAADSTEAPEFSAVNDVSVFGDTEDGEIGFTVADIDLSALKGEMNIFEAVNNMAGEEIFKHKEFEKVYSEGLTAYGGDFYSLGEGNNELTLGVRYSGNELIFLSHEGSVDSVLTQNYDNGSYTDNYKGNYFVELAGDSGEMELSYRVEGEEGETVELVLWSVSSEDLIRLNKMVTESEGYEFKYVPVNTDYTGTRTAVCSVAYAPGYDITVNGKPAQTFDYGGRYAILLEGGEAEYRIKIDTVVSGSTEGFAISLTAFAVSGTIMVYVIYNRKKRGAAADDKH